MPKGQGALDVMTPAGRAKALPYFLSSKETSCASECAPDRTGKRLGRPGTAPAEAGRVRQPCRQGGAKLEIAHRLQIGRTSVRRLLATYFNGR